MWWLERAARCRLALRVRRHRRRCRRCWPDVSSRFMASTRCRHRYDAGRRSVATAMAGVDVSQIDAPRRLARKARVAVELRNQLLFDLTGGGAAAATPIHRLAIRIEFDPHSVIVDTTSGRPDVEDYGLNANLYAHGHQDRQGPVHQQRVRPGVL